MTHFFTRYFSAIALLQRLFAQTICSIFILGALSIFSQPLWAVNRYVDITATGANTGTSWLNAYTDLQNAITPSLSGDTIFVAQGTYKPDLALPGNRNLSFNMKTGVVLMGGFPTGGSSLAIRNWVTNPTILSGDIGTAGLNTDNSYHVVRCAGQQGELNGFIVEKGYANAAAPDNDGGGVFITAGYLMSRFCVFRNNFASDQGGGTYHDAAGNPQYRQCKFESNTAGFGGGSYLFASTIVANCVYINNVATTNGGGVYAVVNINMYNNTFKGNSATTSGNAIYYQNGGSNKLYNGIVWGNTGSATHIAGAGSIGLEYCIIQGGCPGGGASCSSILNTDPLYADAVGRLSASSPAIDAGYNTGPDFNNNSLTIDFDNNNRNFDAIPGGGTRDLGAFEFPTANLSKYYVDLSASGTNSGSSWANAFTSFQSALAIASIGDTVFVAAGTYKPSVGVSARGKTFSLNEGVKYYGGFPAGGGTMAQRDFVANRTILSGDIGTVGVSTDNCYLVVDAVDKTNATKLSGFTIEYGRADSTGFTMYSKAGGMYLGSTGSASLDSVTFRNNYGGSGSAINGDNPTNWQVVGCDFNNNTNGSAVFLSNNPTGSFLNCSFSNNSASSGAAITFNVLTANFTITNCDFISNIALSSGGGGAINAGNASLAFTNCFFTNNSATNGPGGAFYKFYSTLNTFTNCTFIGNNSGGGSNGGGAIRTQGGVNLIRCVFKQNFTTGTSSHGGAVYNNGSVSNIENCLFWNNTTTIGLGGAIYNNTGGTVNITNSTFAKNNAVGFTQGGGINNNSNSNATIKNSIFWGNLANNNDAGPTSEIGHGSGTLSVSNTIWQDNATGGTIINQNPLFTDYVTGDLTLTACSPAIDAGIATGAPIVDLSGNPRPVNGDGLGGSEFDLGAYEVQIVVNNPEINVVGNTLPIIDGSGTTSLSNHTDFDAMAVCNGTIVRTFTIENTGVGSLAISSVNITGANAADFTITDAPAISVAAGSSTTFEVTFDPSATAIRNAIITINTNDCNEAAFDFAIRGTDNVTFAAPTAICQNVTLNLDSLGVATLAPSQVNNGSSDYCGIASMALSRTAFSCNDANAGKIFWTGSDNISKSKNDGASTTNLLTPSASLYTLSVVPELGYIYFSNFNAGKIQRMDFAGGNITDIKSGVQPFGIDVDPIAGKIYWADPNANTISRCNLDGTGTQIIVSGAGNADYSRTLKIDQVNGKLYWTDANLGTIKRCNLDGTALQTLVTGQGNIVGLDLDVANNKMYFSSYSFNQVKRCNLDGTGIVVFLNSGTLPLGVALDLVAGKIYVAHGIGTNNIKKANIDGTGLTTILSGLPTPYDIAVFPQINVNLTVTDSTNISSTCTSNVTVEDVILPAAVAQNVTVSLNGSGTATITPAMINNGSNDACGISSVAVSPSSFNCGNLGSNNVTLTVTDVNGNVSTANATVTVQDNTLPTISCPANTSFASTGGLCGASVTFATPLGTDNCAGSITTQTTGLPSASIFPIGITTNTFVVTDAAGNAAQCSFTVTVLDVTLPNISCPTSFTVGTDAGTCNAVVNYIAPVGTDNCPGAVTTQIAGLPSGATFPIGTTTNTFRVTDAIGNTKDCSFTITVNDVTGPIVVTQDITILLDNSGNATITAAQVDNGSSDGCGIVSMSVFPSTFNCFNAGNNTVTLTAIDNYGSSSSATAIVTVNSLAFAPLTVSPVSIAINPGQIITYTGSTPLGVLRWYNAGNVLVGTGNTYVTPVLPTATTFTAKAELNGCESSGTLLTVTLKPSTTFGGRKAN